MSKNEQSPVPTGLSRRRVGGAFAAAGAGAVALVGRGQPAHAETLSGTQAVDSIDGLREMSGNEGQTLCVVAGYHGPGTPGGGAFLWEPANTTEDDGGVVIRPTGSSGPGRWVRWSSSR